MNDSPVDIGIQNNFSNPVTPVVGKPIPIVAYAVFLDHTWNESSAARSGIAQDNDNTDGQAPDAFRVGRYALGNLLYTPVPNVMMGAELQWGRRENFTDGFQSDGFKIEFSFRYKLSWKLGGSVNIYPHIIDASHRKAIEERLFVELKPTMVATDLNRGWRFAGPSPVLFLEATCTSEMCPPPTDAAGQRPIRRFLEARPLLDNASCHDVS